MSELDKNLKLLLYVVGRLFLKHVNEIVNVEVVNVGLDLKFNDMCDVGDFGVGDMVVVEGSGRVVVV